MKTAKQWLSDNGFGDMIGFNGLPDLMDQFLKDSQEQFEPKPVGYHKCMICDREILGYGYCSKKCMEKAFEKQPSQPEGKAERYFQNMRNHLRDYNEVYTPWINEIIKLAKSEPSQPVGEVKSAEEILNKKGE